MTTWLWRMASSLRYNLRIPQDLSIAGFDDAIFAHAMSPRLTTCRQPIGKWRGGGFRAESTTATNPSDCCACRTRSSSALDRPGKSGRTDILIPRLCI